MTMYIIPGILAFALYFVYDINSVNWNNKYLHKFFTLGSAILGVSLALPTFKAFKNSLFLDNLNYGFLVLSITFLILTIYTLFFALPFENTYLEKETSKPKVCDSGVYRICRHPGIWTLFAFILFLGLALNSNTILLQSIVFTLANICYVIFQDVYTFPKFFGEDYNIYKRKVPFLIPNYNSINQGIRTLIERREENSNETRREA